MKQLKQSLFASAIPFSARRKTFVKYPFAYYNEQRFERRKSSFCGSSGVSYLGAVSPVYGIARGAGQVLQQVELIDSFSSHARTGSRFDAAKRHTCSLDMGKLFAEQESLRVSKLMRSSIQSDGYESAIISGSVVPNYRVQSTLNFSSAVKFVYTE